MKIKRLFLSSILLLSIVLSACSTGNGANSQPYTSSGTSQSASTATNEADSSTAQINTSDTQDERYLNLTFDGTDIFTAALIESPATEEFLTHLPLTLNMTDYLNREKHAGLPFSIAEENLTNIQTPYEIGDVIYYPPGPTFAMYYDHDGREISAGMEVIARLDDAGIAALAERSGAVEVTIELAV